MRTEQVLTLTMTFEGHAQQTENGVEYWLARDHRHLLGYSQWDNFFHFTSKAKTVCEVSEHQVSDHFADVGKTISMPNGAEKKIPEILLILKAKDFAAESTIFNSREKRLGTESATDGLSHLQLAAQSQHHRIFGDLGTTQ